MATEPKQQKPRRNVLGMIARALLGVLAMAVMIGIGFGAGFVYFANPMSPAQDMLRLMSKDAAPAEGDHGADAEADPNLPHKVPRATPEKEEFVTSYFTFAEPLTSNVAGSRRFLQVGIGLSTEYDAKVFAHVQAHEQALKSDILTVISSFTEEDLMAREGRSRLATALRDAINARLVELEGFGGIKDVFFPSFVMQ